MCCAIWSSLQNVVAQCGSVPSSSWNAAVRMSRTVFVVFVLQDCLYT